MEWRERGGGRRCECLESCVQAGSVTEQSAHIAALRTILMTYHTFSPELGYVQGELRNVTNIIRLTWIGMSDLLSPIYVVFDANEADAFWGLVGVMRMMVSVTIQARSLI